MFFGWGTRRTAVDGAELEPPAASFAPPTSTDIPILAESHDEAPLQGSRKRPDNRADMAGEKRDTERVGLEGHQVKGEVMVFQPMAILDLSVTGAQIETTFALQLDSVHDFRLSLDERSVIVKGRIVHCHIGELTDFAAVYRTGVEFVAVPEHALDAIADFVTVMKFNRTAPPVVDGIIAEEE
jgi:hypothetical protein